jgi:hypothetical protein
MVTPPGTIRANALPAGARNMGKEAREGAFAGVLL